MKREFVFFSVIKLQTVQQPAVAKFQFGNDFGDQKWKAITISHAICLFFFVDINVAALTCTKFPWLFLCDRTEIFGIHLPVDGVVDGY